MVCLVWQHVKLSDVSFWDPPRYSLVVGEDVEEPNKQAFRLSPIHHRSRYLELCLRVDL